MTTVVCCNAKTERRAQSIRDRLRQLGYDECFEERIEMQELLISVRLHKPSEKLLIQETLQRAGGVQVIAWKERAA